ncbi:hypothetical protein PFICI_03989 [Pestalotiopsis fici W106-1]|uniref:Heterokaryon incompatibility domain-containing protein n=1 Tax=Pestalotiopsis fici (strain W106-1 / CGMCC3.15140) TaxID=1229662 RepID=W3XIX4_PESFW|nr:uncharacterized protein PFICI_03989 [Pestalotiopsis fici W106-1]ETS85964.1 hypothetical protein PFICI_03989 [Pestalotiopsis fici W106-1]
MDHIIADFELPPNAVPPVPDLTEDGAQFPDDWDTFQSYPRDNGWRLDENTYNLKLLGTERRTVDRPKFLQSWLFFGLIFTIVQQEGKPILQYKQLVEVKANSRRVTTKHLPAALEKWRKWEQERCDLGYLSEIRLRMVRVEAVLDAARRTIRANYGYSLGSHAQQPRTVDDEQSTLRDKVALSLMILGETLSLFKAQIMKATQSELKGWHSEDGRGWGPPAYILNRMGRDKWCKRTIHLWQSQLRANATLMLASYLAYNSLDRFKGPHHNGCDETDCKVMPTDKDGLYQSAHAYGCDTFCGMQGPDLTFIRGHLDNDEIPLLQFNQPPNHDGNGSQISLSVSKIPENKTRPFKYATISHVWSDGYGNETENKLPCCQLRYVRNILNKLDPEDGWETPFWMDTLVIPVGPGQEDRTRRKRAIKQIFQVFKESTYTIVLDAGLAQLNPGEPDRPAVAAMRILGSSWMRRLWTLQEAFLSQKIYFAFDYDDQLSHLKDLKELSQDLASGGHAQATTALLDMVNDHLQHLIMSHEQETRDTYLFPEAGLSGSKMPQEKAALLVASSWKAARWRTTSNSFHETLALATLLNLDYEGTKIAEQGLRQRNVTEQRWLWSQMREKDPLVEIRDRDRLVEIFWTQFNDRWHKSIPPGIIFLPGDRVERIGFGWAPRTWMTAQPVDHPDPLALMTSTATMNGKDGLQVRYPGFILHPQERSHILATDKHRKRFWFPTGPSFLDWYVVETIEDDTPQQFIQKIQESDARLGIIVSRVKPGDSPAEIGLLVQIREERTNQASTTGPLDVVPEEQEPSQRSDAPTTIHQKEREASDLYCEIVRRVKVSRETRAEFRTRNRARFLTADDREAIPSHRVLRAQDMPTRGSMVPQVMTDSADTKGKICLAEELGPEQVWNVDGFFPDRDNPRSPNGATDRFQPPDNARPLLLRLFGGSGQPKQKQPDNSDPPRPLPRISSARDQLTNSPQPGSHRDFETRKARTFPKFLKLG